jgi:Spy/CpxP family protein refolding chaperone
MKQLFAILIVTLFMVSATAAQQGGQGHAKCGDFGPRAGGHGQWSGQCGQGDGHGSHRGGGIQRLLGMSDEIGLSEDQQDQLKDMAIKFKLEMVDLRADVQRARINTRALRRDDDAREADVMKAIDDVAAAQAGVKKASYQHRQAFRSILTAEQLDKLDALHQECATQKGDQPSKRGVHEGRHGR